MSKLLKAKAGPEVSTNEEKPKATFRPISGDILDEMLGKFIH